MLLRTFANIRLTAEAKTRFWTASDGVRLAYHELGLGRPVVLLDGLFSDSSMYWINFGQAARIARCVL